jgi:hypothetical protein
MIRTMSIYFYNHIQENTMQTLNYKVSIRSILTKPSPSQRASSQRAKQILNTLPSKSYKLSIRTSTIRINLCLSCANITTNMVSTGQCSRGCPSWHPYPTPPPTPRPNPYPSPPPSPWSPCTKFKWMQLGISFVLLPIYLGDLRIIRIVQYKAFLSFIKLYWCSLQCPSRPFW